MIVKMGITSIWLQNPQVWREQHVYVLWSQQHVPEFLWDGCRFRSEINNIKPCSRSARARDPMYQSVMYYVVQVAVHFLLLQCLQPWESSPSFIILWSVISASLGTPRVTENMHPVANHCCSNHCIFLVSSGGKTYFSASSIAEATVSLFILILNKM